MNKIHVAPLLLALAAAGCTGLPNLKENGTDVDVGVDVLGKYVWRGIVVSDVTVAEPSVNVANGGFTANVWGNLDLEKQDSVDNERQFNEIDLTMSYGHSLGPVDITGGVIHYIFPNNGLPTPGATPGSTLKDGDTTELFAAASLPDVPLTPTLAGYMDVDETGGGGYLNLSGCYSIDLGFFENPSFSSVDLSAGLGWGSSEYNNFYFGGGGGPTGSGLVDFTASLGVPIDLGADGKSGWVVTPAVTYTSLVDTDLRHAHDGGHDSNLIWGVSFAVTF